MTTLEQIAQETRNHGEGRPDLGMPPQDACAYYDPDREVPVCIVGHALYDLDVSSEILYALDHSTGVDSSTESSATIDSLDALRALDIDPPERGSDEWWTLYWLKKVQEEQDGGYSWGEAIEVADDFIASRKATGPGYLRLRFEDQLEDERKTAQAVKENA